MPCTKPSHWRSLTEAKPAPTSQASGELPHMDIKKTFVKQAQPASSGLTVASRQIAAA